MATKLYLYSFDALASGTPPSGEQSAQTPDQQIYSSLKAMGRVKGQTSGAASATANTIARTASQLLAVGQWASLPLSGSGTIGGGSMSFGVSEAESNTAANFWINGVEAYVWRPSTGAKVGTIKAFAGTSMGGTEPTSASSAQTTYITGLSTSGVSYQDGDIIVAELWSVFSQGMSTSYVATVYLGGTTDVTSENAANSTPASFVEFAENVTFKTEVSTANSTTWSAVNKPTSITLSGSNKTATYSGATPIGLARVDESRSSGKYYFEGTWSGSLSPSQASYGYGFCTAAYDDIITGGISSGGSQNNCRPGETGHSDSYLIYGDGVARPSGTSTGKSWATEMFMGIAVDITAGKIWVRDSSGWYGDPVAGTGEAQTFTGGTAVYPLGYAATSGKTFTVNTGDTAFNWTPPSGYTAWEAGQSVGAASGTGSAAGVGAATTSAAGAASGTGGASAKIVVTSAGAASAAGPASGVGAPLGRGTGSATSAGTAAGEGVGAYVAVGAATGIGAASAAYDSSESVGSAAGVGAASAQGAASTSGAATATATGSASGTIQVTAAGAGTAAGIGVGSGAGQATTNVQGTATATGAASGYIRVDSSGVGAASGAGGAAGGGVQASEGVGSASGVTVGAGIGAPITVGAGSSDGTGAAVAASAVTAVSAGSSFASGIAAAVGRAFRLMGAYGARVGLAVSGRIRQVAAKRIGVSTSRRSPTMSGARAASKSGTRR